MACKIVLLRIWFERRLRIERFKEMKFSRIFSKERILRCSVEWLIIMMIPYPGLISKSFFYFNPLYKRDVEYQWNNWLHILSIARILYFGYHLITLSRHWSASAQRIA